MKKLVMISLFVVFLSFVIGAYFYQNIESNTIASHWNTRGEVDGYMGKFWGIFMIPLMCVGLFILFLLVPKVDPLKKNIEKFGHYYHIFMLVMISFLVFTFILMGLANMGYNVNMGVSIMIAIGFLFFFIGAFMKKIKRNWFIGIRTPWTMSNDKVWEKTHKLGGILFSVLGIVMIVAILFPAEYVVWVILGPTLAVTISLFFYSYFEYKKLSKK